MRTKYGSNPDKPPSASGHTNGNVKKAKVRKGVKGNRDSAFENGNGKRKWKGGAVKDGDAKANGREEGKGAKRRKASNEGESLGGGGGGNEASIGEGEEGTVQESTNSAKSKSQLQTNALATEKDSTTTKADASSAILIPVFPGLENTHAVTTMSIISSSNIGKKVSRILDVLSPQSGDQDEIGTEGTAKTKGKGKDVVMLYAKAPVACKLVSIVEIVKREVAKEGGKWFAYCGVGEVVGEVSALDTKKEKGKGKGGNGKIDKDKKGSVSVDVDGQGEEGEEEGHGDEEEEEEAFEVMKTPFERALESEARPKVRAMPVMSLYLSRCRNESLRMVYGEQTNAQEAK